MSFTNGVLPRTTDIVKSLGLDVTKETPLKITDPTDFWLYCFKDQYRYSINRYYADPENSRTLKEVRAKRTISRLDREMLEELSRL